MNNLLKQIDLLKIIGGTCIWGHASGGSYCWTKIQNGNIYIKIEHDDLQDIEKYKNAITELCVNNRCKPNVGRISESRYRGFYNNQIVIKPLR